MNTRRRRVSISHASCASLGSRGAAPFAHTHTVVFKRSGVHLWFPARCRRPSCSMFTMLTHDISVGCGGGNIFTAGARTRGTRARKAAVLNATLAFENEDASNDGTARTGKVCNASCLRMEKTETSRQTPRLTFDHTTSYPSP